MGIVGKQIYFNQTDSVYMCSVSDSLFGGDYHAKFYIDTAVADSIWSSDAVLWGDSVLFPLVEGRKHYRFFVRMLNGDTLQRQLTFTSLPVVALEGTFGYDYALGSVSMSLPSGVGQATPMQARIKWRGGTTNAPDKHKRNYKIKFVDTEGKKQERSFFGFRKDDEWILNAGQVDLLRCRNQIAHNLWYDIASAPYYAAQEPKALTAVRGEFVEVLLNGEYRGIYSFTEPMDRKQMRLKKYDELGAVTHGQLWKTDSWDGTKMYDIAPYDNNKETWRGFETKYPDFDDVNPTDYATLYNAIAFVVNSTDEEFAREVERWFDVPVLLDYYIFISVLGARDNNGKNMYWGCYDQTVEPKLTLAVWDLDCTVGQNYTDKDPHPDSWGPYISLEKLHNLLHRLLAIQKYRDAVQLRYWELQQGYLNADALKERYTACMEHFMRSGAAARESERWSGDTDICGLTLDFEEELNFVTDWIDKRITFLNEGEFSLKTSSLPPPPDWVETTDQNAVWFNVLGLPVAVPAHGVYILKGKKYFIK